jgi:hypothetical protein
MIRFAFRFIGLWALAAAFVWLVIDGTRSIASNAISVTKLGTAWSDISPGSFEALQPAIDRHVPEWLGNSMMHALMEQPTFLVLGIVGVLLILLGRKPKPVIGYGRD